MNLNPLHLVNSDGRLKGGNIVHYLSIILRWQAIGGTGKGIQHG